MRNWQILEERGFQVKQILINCVLGIVAAIILYLMLVA